MTHGFLQKALGIDATIKPGATAEVVLTPQTAGRFTTICDHFCGAGHGNTGVPFAEAMAAPVPSLNSPNVQGYKDGQLKWIIENGIFPSGMPASKGILNDDEIWQIVHYIRHLPPKAAWASRLFTTISPKAMRPSTARAESTSQKVATGSGQINPEVRATRRSKKDCGLAVYHSPPFALDWRPIGAEPLNAMRAAILKEPKGKRSQWCQRLATRGTLLTDCKHDAKAGLAP